MADFKPRGAGQLLTIMKVGRFAFHYTDSVGTPDFEQISGLNCLMTLSPDFLRLARRVTTSYSRFATGGAVTPYQAGFPPAKCCALCWAHLCFCSFAHPVSRKSQSYNGSGNCRSALVCAGTGRRDRLCSRPEQILRKYQPAFTEPVLHEEKS